MAYITQDELAALVPDEWIQGSLDDDEDGSQDSGLWEKIIAAVDEDIDGRISPRYGPNVSPVPALIKAAARAIGASLLWKRWGRGDEHNPWSGEAERLQRKLDLIGEGKLSLTAEDPDEGQDVIGEPIRTFSPTGKLMV